MPQLVWFREDLRVADNRALYHACQDSDDGVIAVFLICQRFWEDHDMAACRVGFLMSGLSELKAELMRINVPLLIRNADSVDDMAAAVLKLCQRHQCDTVHVNRQYEWNEVQRDVKVAKTLAEHDVEFLHYHDQVILPPESVLTAKDSVYTVFTPYKKSWFNLYREVRPACLPAPQRQPSLEIASNDIPFKASTYMTSLQRDAWPAGENEAQRRLQVFIETKIDDYQTWRDFPNKDNTSTLSPYLSTGMISARQCLEAALVVNGGELDAGNSGITTWISELIWREFYKQLLYHMPHLSKHKPFKAETDQLAWRYDEEDFQAWCEGRTGYPIVDAAMRQLRSLGWMHNRLRMVTAMFLTKDLLIDWRWGERHFMRHLLDGDLAANNGGWQWSASTGCDAAPYFRLFNPTRQSEKFDPDGEFIKYYCPELSSLDRKSIHEPYAYLGADQLDYPRPMVDHGKARERVLQAFKAIK